MATAPTEYAPFSLTSTIRALDPETAEEEAVTFSVGNLTSPNSLTATQAAMDAITQTLTDIHPGWTITGTVQYTGRSIVYTLNGDELPT